jgi:acyl-CoA reductase-like NAD-dependent aldehyde dehydrogenase
MSYHEVMNRARAAQAQWKQQTVSARLVHIRTMRRQLVEDLDHWLNVFAEETKKTPTDALTSELLLFTNACLFYEKRAKKILKTRKVSTPLQFFGQQSWVAQEAYGVVLIISPWNFPLQLSMIPLISALIAGNAVVLKPSEHVPLLNQKIAEWLQRCGLPKHIVQIIEGDGTTGAQLIDAKPDKVFFTGGGVAGRKVYERAAQHLIPVDLELGGNDPMIVCADAHLERAARAAIWGGFMHSGQVCVGVERVYVHRSLYEPFVRRVVELTRQLRQGTTADDDLGGMTTDVGFARVKNLLDEAVAQGAVIECGGYSEHVQAPYFPPTVVTAVHDEMKIVQEETFGPILSITPVASDEEALQRANGGAYGLNGYIFTRDLDKARRMAAALVTGNVYINGVIVNISNMHLPFGGAKASGFGRYHGAAGLLTFCQAKSLMIDRGTSSDTTFWFPYNHKKATWLKRFLRWLGSR